MKPGKIATLIIYLLIILFLGVRCKTYEITYLGIITSRYPQKASLISSSDSGVKKVDTIIRAKVTVELLGGNLANFPSVQASVEKSFFDTIYPRKYEIIIRNIGDSSKIAVNSMDSIIRKKNVLKKKEFTTIRIQGYVYRGNLNTPSQRTFIILGTMPQKKSAYTDSKGFFEFGNISRSDFSLLVFDEDSWRFIEIPLRLMNLSSLNQIKILLTPR
jgi:hypothetical protein